MTSLQQQYYHPSPRDGDSVTCPQSVIYCGACGMPPEYCSYGPDFETHCRPWLKKSHPKLYEILHVVASSTSSTSSSADDPTIDAAVVSSDPNAATAPWTTRERLAAFYTQYMPDKLDGIDAILEKYEGKEDKLFLALVKKYGRSDRFPGSEVVF